jgi:hypothetical protein
VPDEVDGPLHEDIVRDIVLEEAELLVTHQMCDIVRTSRDQIVDADDRMSFCKKSLAEMGAQEAGTTGHN